ncbi:bacteriocin biosynthesis cyclodehydratase domain-containing protein [Marmoricola sp. URHA0025 HA25]
MRLVLAPGLRVVRRSRSLLQVGLAAQRRVLLPDTEPVRRTLGHLVRGEVPPEDAGTREVLGALAPVLVDATGLVAPGIADGDVAAAALRDPAGYRDRLAARQRATVLVQGALGDVDPLPLLRAAGLRVVDAPDPEPTAVLVLSVGELDRDRVDRWVRAGVAHLAVRMVEGEAVVGPFVEPGLTACLRCLDAHRAEDDPRAAVLAAGHARARDDRRDGVAEPVDTALATLALAWAVRDLVSLAEGERPSTWSTTLELSATLSSVTQAEWRRHPGCGCCWLPIEHSSRTMAM